MKYYQNRKKRLKRFLIMFTLSAITVTSFVMADVLISPIIKSAASKRATSYATYIISNAVCERISDDEIKYSDIVTFEKDDEGRICALKTDVIKLNRLKSEIATDVYKKMNNIKSEEISIPLGTVLGSSIFAGRGPAVKTKMMSVGAVTSDFENIFTSAGINQTNHRIMIKVNINFSVLAPFELVPVSVTTSVCAAESVIVGSVPQAFTNVHNSGYSEEGETVADEVVDFGAHNFIN